VSGPPPRDNAFAGQLEGAVVLVGATYASPAGKRTERFYVVVEAAVRDKGVPLHPRGSRECETFRLPPDLGNLALAGPGRYPLRATGKVVVDPDYATTWTIHPPRSWRRHGRLRGAGCISRRNLHA